MAEMIIPQKKGNRKIHSLRVDLTPMVDLGFLLITFFMLSTTLAEQKVMKVDMPYNGPVKVPTVFVEEATITVIPIKGHQLCYYFGALKSPSQISRVSMTETRAVLLKKKNSVATLPASFLADAHKLHVLIKPNNDCSYSDLVSLFDEMSILSIEHYALVDITNEEREAVASGN